MITMRRFFRALFQAARMTLRGEALQPPEQRYPRLAQWVSQGTRIVNAVYKAAEQQGLDAQTRETVMMRLDSRDISMETVIGAVRHNMLREYPMLMDARIEHNLTTLYALNMNDQYRVQRLAELDRIQGTPVQEQIARLSQHLQAIPPSSEAHQPVESASGA